MNRGTGKHQHIADITGLQEKNRNYRQDKNQSRNHLSTCMLLVITSQALTRTGTEELVKYQLTARYYRFTIQKKNHNYRTRAKAGNMEPFEYRDVG